MIRPSSLNNKSILENLYRILRMSLLLGDTENKDETVANFEDTAIKLDNIEQEEYNKNLDSKFYTTVTLEEEERKLSDLIKYVSERVESRKKIEDEYEEAVGRPLGGLEPIAEAENINNYQVRLDYIKEYLDNSKKIESTEKDIEELKNQLEQEEEIKKEYEKLNDQMENQLIDKFNDIIHSFEDDYYQNLDATNIDSDIATLDTTIEENKKSLDIFTKSYETLRSAGISTQDEIEYSKYVKEAKEVYYKNVEQRYLLKLYKLVFDSVTDFESIFQKRTQINSLLEERLDIRKELNIETRDSLLPLYSMLDEQYKEVETEKENIDNISSINEKIKFKQAKLEKERFSLFSKDTKHCYFCSSGYELTWHELFRGRNRQNSMKYGLCLRMCSSCHELYQEDKHFNDFWHVKGQATFEEAYPELDFVKIFNLYYK